MINNFLIAFIPSAPARHNHCCERQLTYAQQMQMNDDLFAFFMILNFFWFVSLLHFWGKYDKTEGWGHNRLFNRSALWWGLDWFMIIIWVFYLSVKLICLLNHKHCY